MREDDELDQLIHAALVTYGEADDGLERRILNRVSAQSYPKRRLWLPWVVALPVAACFILLFLLFGPRPNHAPASKGLESAGLPQAPVPIPPVVREAPSPRIHSRMPTPPSVRRPKRDVFPTPQPLSPKERALADFVAQATISERRSLLQAQEQLDKPIEVSAIHIDAIHIPPLDSPQPGGAN